MIKVHFVTSWMSLDKLLNNSGSSQHKHKLCPFKRPNMIQAKYMQTHSDRLKCKDTSNILQESHFEGREKNK